MSLNYENLDVRTRELMVQEIDIDVGATRLYLSPRLSPIGAVMYEDLLRLAAAGHDDGWLAGQLRLNNYMNATEQRSKRNGGSGPVKVPVTAPDTLAEGEFNRFYARAVCARAIVEGKRIRVYRGKDVNNPRAESEAMIGKELDPTSVLYDLRIAQGVEPGLGLPPGPNSGLTIALV